MFELIAIILLGVIGIIVSYVDFKEQKIPDVFSLTLLFSSIILLIITNQFQDLAWLSIFIILDYLFYGLGIWAGGDFKITIGIFGILLFFSQKQNFTEILTLTGVFLLIAFVLATVFSTLKRISTLQGKKKEITNTIIKNSIQSILLTQSMIFLTSKMPFYWQVIIGITILGVTLFLKIPTILTGIIFLAAIILEPIKTLQNSLYFLPIIILISLAFNVIKLIPLKRIIKVNELKEGTILEGEYYLENNRLKQTNKSFLEKIKNLTENRKIIYSETKARGLNIQEINELKKHHFKEGFEKISIPLAPFLIISSLIMLVAKIA